MHHRNHPPQYPHQPYQNSHHPYQQDPQQIVLPVSQYLQLTKQLETLQRHILKVQTQKQSLKKQHLKQHEIFISQNEKLKIYIDQCENQIKKREEREVLLIQRLSQLEEQLEREEEKGQLKRENQRILEEDTARKSRMVQDMVQKQLREKEELWNLQRASLVKDYQQLLHNHNLLKQENTHLKQLNRKLTDDNQTLTQSNNNFEQLLEQNNQLKNMLSELQQQFKPLSQAQKSPILHANCPNCRDLIRSHEFELLSSQTKINSLQKDLECLMLFFQ